MHEGATEAVISTRRPYLVSNLAQLGISPAREAMERTGVRSMMALPLDIPRFHPNQRETIGVIQIGFPELDRASKTLEIHLAQLMARRLSFVIVRRKIHSLQRVNEKKEAIVAKIFRNLGTQEGIRMRDVFNRVIPELADIINIQSCALFSVSEDGDHVVLEAGYPETHGYHGIGRRFSIQAEPAFAAVLNPGERIERTPGDLVTRGYVLVTDPQSSRLLSSNLKEFSFSHNINSILYVPLRVGEDIAHFITFDALDHRKTYTDEEIEVLLFLGRELIKAQSIERLDDVLHDFKNPAIAIAGFARRLKRLLQQQNCGAGSTEVDKCLNILLEETTRLQELALSTYKVGSEQVVNLTERVRQRFEINEQAIKEQLKQNVKLRPGPFHDPLYIRCYPLQLERVFDNLLNNATNAVPPQGGRLSIRTFKDGDWACAEISNTGRISDEALLRISQGWGRGRGLGISQRIVHLLRGRLEFQVAENTTTFVARLPLHVAEECTRARCR
jgi:signal transduction histidine kinase